MKTNNKMTMKTASENPGTRNIIDVTPTWEQVLPILLEVSRSANAEGKKIAYEELRKMARLADAYNEILKAKIKNDGVKKRIKNKIPGKPGDPGKS